MTGDHDIQPIDVHLLKKMGDRRILRELQALHSPLLMGILNLTPDSFSDGGDYLATKLALRRVEQMVAQGVDIIDIGGESTRPGAQVVSVQQELDRIMPVVEYLRTYQPSLCLSVDTRKPEVMQQVLQLGVHMINDVNALQADGALAIVAQSKCSVCLMHCQGIPETMQQQPHYRNVVFEVRNFLEQRIQACVDVGIDRARITIDPGFGFGKTLSHNLQLLKQLNVLTELDYPVIVGLSRKSTIGHILNKPIDQRANGSLAAHTIALWQGARIIRTHDIEATRDTIDMIQALQSSCKMGTTT